MSDDGDPDYARVLWLILALAVLLALYRTVNNYIDRAYPKLAEVSK